MRNNIPILLYDIDGTLLRVNRNFLLALITEQLTRVKIPKPGGEVKSFAGRTDRGIFMEIIGERNDAENLFLQLKENYSNAMLEQLKPEFIERIDDAAESVWEAVELSVPVGLCTGNFRSVAMKKVETAGLSNVFRFGGFGGSHSSRNLLPGDADREYRELFKDIPKASQYVIIGDTPNDIRCARHFGARSVAVATGMFTKKELAAEKPDLVLCSLKNPKGWLTQLGFDGF